MLIPPQVKVGGIALNLNDVRTAVLVGKNTLQPGVEAQGLLPGQVLMRYHIIFDYPSRKFTIALPGSIKPYGIPISSPVNKQTGFPRLEVQIENEKFGFLLDTGASFTMVSQDLIDKWIKEHSDWKHVTGAISTANMGIGSIEAKLLQLRIPKLQLSKFILQGVGAISWPKGTFEDYMSPLISGPIIEAIGGNLLSAFRVEIDYAKETTYLEQKRPVNQYDTDMVGLTLQAKRDGSYVVSAISDQNGKSVINTIRSKDKLIKIDNLVVNGISREKVIKALSGKLNEKRTLILERDGKQFTVVAPVVRNL